MVVTDDNSLGQIAHMDVSKLNAVNEVSEILNFNLKDVISFGDDFNDIDMISECGIGVAMGNSPEEVKASADIVTLTNDEDGVAIELEKLL